jgi:hypothetical protein
MAAPRGPTSPPARAAPTPRPRAPSFARVLRRPWELGQETWETPALCSPCAVWPGSVRGTINTNPLTSIRPSSEKRWSGGARRARRDPPPGPGPGATRDRHYNGTGLQPPPPRLPRRGPPGAHTRNRAASSVDIMVPFTAFSAVWVSSPDFHRAGRGLVRRTHVVLASCDLILNLSFAVKKTSATSDRHS